MEGNAIEVPVDNIFLRARKCLRVYTTREAPMLIQNLEDFENLNLFSGHFLFLSDHFFESRRVTIHLQTRAILWSFQPEAYFVQNQDA